MSSENGQSSAPSASRCYRAAADKMGRQFFSHDQFSMDAIRWLSERWRDLHVEFHECEGWHVSTCYADEAWGDDRWVCGDGSLHSALLKAVEVTSRLSLRDAVCISSHGKGRPMADSQTIREKFEAWITAPPYEQHAGRYPLDDERYPFPGTYQNYWVQLAWEAYCEAWGASEIMPVLQKDNAEAAGD